MCSSLPDSHHAGYKLPLPLGNARLDQAGQGREGSGTPSLIPSKPHAGAGASGTRQRKDLSFLRHSLCLGRFKEDSVHQCSITWTRRPATGNPFQEQLPRELREGKPGGGNSFAGSCLPPRAAAPVVPEASVLHEDLPAPGEDGEKLGAPVLLIAVAMDRIVKPGQAAKAPICIPLPGLAFFYSKKKGVARRVCLLRSGAHETLPAHSPILRHSGSPRTGSLFVGWVRSPSCSICWEYNTGMGRKRGGLGGSSREVLPLDLENFGIRFNSNFALKCG